MDTTLIVLLVIALIYLIAALVGAFDGWMRIVAALIELAKTIIEHTNNNQ